MTIPGSPVNPGHAGLTILVDDSRELTVVQNLTEEYENQTGVSVVVKQVSPGSGNTSAVLPPGDLLISGFGHIQGYASDGQLIPLNSLLNTSSSVNWTICERPSLTMVGEFPDRSGTIYALPFDQDALGIAFRADLFDDPNKSAAFCATYGYPLAVPGSYEELEDITEFFSQYGSQQSGIGFAGLQGSDPISSPWLSLVTSYGSGIYDRSSGLASGTWNSSRTIAAMTMIRNLTNYGPSDADTWGDKDVAEAISSGSLAIAITWFSQFSGIQAMSEEHNLSIGYIPLPGESMNDGSFRGITIRMDGIGIRKGGSEERALAFLTWFYSPDVQLSFGKNGHQPALISVLDSNSYLSMNPYNRAFPESMRVGVTAEKGEHAEAVRLICEDAINAIVSDDNMHSEEMMRILNASAASIDSIRLKQNSSS